MNILERNNLYLKGISQGEAREKLLIISSDGSMGARFAESLSRTFCWTIRCREGDERLGFSGIILGSIVRKL